MKYDKPLIAVLIGMLAMMPTEVFTLILKFTGLTKLSAFEITSVMLIRDGSWWLGILTGPGTAGLVTLVLYRLTKSLGTDYLPLKGAGIAMITYAWIIIIFGILGRNSNLEMPVISHYANALAGGLGGALSGFLLKEYLFKEQSETSKLNQKITVRKYTILPSPAKKQDYFHNSGGPKIPIKLKRWKHW